MKKKGLIISTIVMVVVLIASLTTATYAWFTASAQASINEMTIQTVTGTGLQIATYRGSDLYSGSVVKIGDSTNGYYWATEGANETTPGEANGWGSDVSFQASGSDQFLIKDMYGASGDGVTMFAQSNPDLAINHQSGDPVAYDNVKAAVANLNYFVADVALFATSAGTVYINQLNITPNGTSAAKNNMAASLRIALFQTLPTSEAQSSVTYAVTGTRAANLATGQFVIDPYMTNKYNGSTMVNSGGASQAYVTSTAYAKSANTLAQTWTGHFISDIGTIATGTVQNVSKTFANLTEATTDNALYSLGEVAVNQMIYLRLVIWFEGEDEACCQNLAGGGANIRINFGLQPATNP